MSSLAIRLLNHRLVQSNLSAAQEVVAWMGAMQAQDLPMSLWGTGLRAQQSQQEVIAAIDQGKIIRTHVMRPTWHLVHAQDVHWMLNLSAESIKKALKSRHKQLGIDQNLLKDVYKLFSNQFKNNSHLTRDTLLELLIKSGIRLEDNRGAHLLMLAELDQILCSGAVIKNETSYACYDQRITLKCNYSREEAIYHLSRRYFQSHGPATVDDFCWWSGLNKSEAKSGILSLGQEIHSERKSEKWYYQIPKVITASSTLNMVQLLPAYDEYIISYTERGEILPAKVQSTTISTNGVFRPVILVNGRAAGLWKRTIKKQSVEIELSWFAKPSREIKKLVQQEVNRFGEFLGIPVVTADKTNL